MSVSNEMAHILATLVFALAVIALAAGETLHKCFILRVRNFNNVTSFQIYRLFP